MTESLVRDLIASGSALLTDMAVAAKTTGEHLYSVLVRQQFVEGLMLAVGIPFWIIIHLLLTKLMKKMFGTDADVVFFIFGLLLTVPFAVLFMQGIGKMINPEFYAIQFIIDSVKPR